MRLMFVLVPKLLLLLLLTLVGTNLFAQYNCKGDCIVGPNPIQEYLLSLEGQPGVRLQTLDLRTYSDTGTPPGCGCGSCFVKIKVYGDNNIVPVTPDEYTEYSGVNGIVCSGKITGGGAAFHVKRDDIIVTNSHVFQDIKTGETADIKDCLYYVMDKDNQIVEKIPLEVARIATVENKNWEGDTEHDYAVVQLARAPTKAKVKILPAEAFNGAQTRIRTIGIDYSPSINKTIRFKSEGVAYAKQNGDIHAAYPTLYAHDADSVPGFSGGPVISLATGAAIGINRGSYKLPEVPKTNKIFSTKKDANEFIIFDEWVISRVNEILAKPKK